MATLILLDRDGTLIHDRHYLSDPEQVELLPGVAAGLLRLQLRGCILAVVSNQSGVGRGYFSEQDVHRCNARLAELLEAENVRIDAWYHCPHAPEENCLCRKPGTGMGEQACAEFQVLPDETFVVGDKPCDVDLGLRLGASSILVSTGSGLAALHACTPDFTAADMEEAADWILRRIAPPKT
ncbi:MAG: HAD family hydrolase [Desulfovibrionaceae bacterium]